MVPKDTAAIQAQPNKKAEKCQLFAAAPRNFTVSAFLALSRRSRRCPVELHL
jgi:hypothetical protein